MFCRNCGEQYPVETSVVCVKCGTPKGKGKAFCPYCGERLAPNSEICLRCGSSVIMIDDSGQKSRVAAGLFAIFFGTFGVHNFYLGYTTKAIIQLCVSSVSILLMCCTFGITGIITGGIGIWAFVEGILILAGKINVDGNGIPLKDQ
ncbi:TM2 domain-containing protein [Anaeromicropila populeti]|uniref:TM2 domain-containing membrane protein YozV n=1 Tax=Anaeromicropila populeti TaxID=37658 RepID=A0A1I6LBE5_9FIRM|nr:TM2 domain-containing protein [Anaeromicropila populeti]SFS00520.1 TM2 domain-containing membrane protein YozV [Anaeromicropila populeti]